MKINPYIFAGLKEPKCQLFFDLQAYIAYNGGRLHLANILECEMVKEYLPKRHYEDTQPWSNDEIELLIDNYLNTTETYQMTILNRSLNAIRSMTRVLHLNKKLPYKQTRKSK